MTQPPLPGPPSGQPSGPPEALPLPFKVRYNPVLGFLFDAVGLLWLVLAINGNTFGYVLAVLFLVLGLVYLRGTCAVIDADRVKVLSPIQITTKDEPIRGLGDLRFEGAALYRVHDNKKLVNLGWGSVAAGDLKRLQAAVGGAARG